MLNNDLDREEKEREHTRKLASIIVDTAEANVEWQHSKALFVACMFIGLTGLVVKSPVMDGIFYAYISFCIISSLKAIYLRYKLEKKEKQ
jgi:hypothetical protein